MECETLKEVALVKHMLVGENLDSFDPHIRYSVYLGGIHLVSFDGSGESMVKFQEMMEKMLLKKGMFLSVEEGDCVEYLSKNEEDENTVRLVDCETPGYLNKYYYLINSRIIDAISVERFPKCSRCGSSKLMQLSMFRYSGVNMTISSLYEGGTFVGTRVKVSQFNSTLVVFDGVGTVMSHIVDSVRGRFDRKLWTLNVIHGSNVYGHVDNGLRFCSDCLESCGTYECYGFNPVEGNNFSYLRERYTKVIEKYIIRVVEETLTSLNDNHAYNENDYLKKFTSSVNPGLFKFSDRFGEPFTVYEKAKLGVNCGIRAYIKQKRKTKTPTGIVVVECYFATLRDYLSFVHNVLHLLGQKCFIDNTMLLNCTLRTGRGVRGRVKYAVDCPKESFLNSVCKVWGIPKEALDFTAKQLRLISDNEFGKLSCVTLRTTLAQCYCLSKTVFIDRLSNLECELEYEDDPLY